MSEHVSASRIALGKKRHGIVIQAIGHWRDNGIIDEQTAAKLTDSISIAVFDWQRTARYAFIVAIFCLVIAVGAILADRVLMQLLMRIFNAPALVKCGFFAAISSAIFFYGLFLREHYPNRFYRNEAVFFLGVLSLAAAVFFLGVALDTGSGHYSLLFLLASALYLLLGLWFPSKQVWVFGLFSLGTWMGTETGYASGQGMYFLGMNYPLRFVIFGAALAALGIAGQRSLAGAHAAATSLDFKKRLLVMSPQTKVMGLLNLFIALWIMSIFGNYADLEQWHKVRQYEFLYWSLAFGATAIAALWYGLRNDDGVVRGFGLTFLFINLYTRFFEYFWGTVHKAAFFAVLAASFWYLGSKAEAIWHLGQRER
jgi:MFS family permease